MAQGQSQHSINCVSEPQETAATEGFTDTPWQINRSIHVGIQLSLSRGRSLQAQLVKPLQLKFLQPSVVVDGDTNWCDVISVR